MSSRVASQLSTTTVSLRIYSKHKVCHLQKTYPHNLQLPPVDGICVDSSRVSLALPHLRVGALGTQSPIQNGPTLEHVTAVPYTTTIPKIRNN